MTILLIYLTAPQVFTLRELGLLEIWNEWMFRKPFKNPCASLFFLSEYWNTWSFVLWGFGTLSLFPLVSESPWVTEIHGHLFSVVWGLYCHFFLYLDLLLFFTCFCLFVFMFKIQYCRRTVLKTLFWEHPCPISTGILDIFSFTLITICMTS